MAGWFLEQLEIEGVRGINNEGSPLSLGFKHDKVNSISATNAVGKSSIFDALTYALTGRIRKLDDLPTAENGKAYYLNRFHQGGVGTIKLSLLSDDGGTRVAITVRRAADGTRTTAASDGRNADELLATLNRDFVLLDSPTFQSFVGYSALDRGRNFAGLLGLSAYSGLRQGLQALSQTRAFNNHFEAAARKAARDTAARLVQQHSRTVSADYLALVGTPLLPSAVRAEAQGIAHHSIAQIALLSPHCLGRTFADINIDNCTAEIRSAESGPARDRLATIIREQEKWIKAVRNEPTTEDIQRLEYLVAERDAMLALTKGDLLRELYQLSSQVLSEPGWSDKSLCPVCDLQGETSLLDKAHEKLSHYATVESISADLATEWAARGWDQLAALEDLTLAEGEANQFRVADTSIASSLTATQCSVLASRLVVIRERASQKIVALAEERLSIEKALPESLVAVTTAIEAARRLQKGWSDLEIAEATLAKEDEWAKRTAELKKFLDDACGLFSDAEANAGTRRLSTVEPLCREFFKAIMHEPVVPALAKRSGSEEFSISLANFFSLRDVSAQALLSESFRNAFAASVYLAAARLYGGAPRFLVLDDITSSFDAGHQLHLLEVIRTRFGRPGNPDGPQVILLSHDTMLEKLFNKNVGSGGWIHQRLGGQRADRRAATKQCSQQSR
jgi:hypothetical protein